MEEILRVRQLSKSYGKKTTVSNLNLTLKKGEVLGLLGANGAGKTTSIECILGTKKADGGEVSLLGLNPIMDRKELFEHVGVQFQDANYQREIRVDELCEETSSIYRECEDYKNFLEKFGIADKIKSQVKDLSGGERQRLFIILSLIGKPQVVFLDELTTGLDARARRDVWKILEELKRDGLSMILTSHFMDEVEALCDVIVILKKGITVFTGTVEEAIKNSPYEKFEDAYLWYTDEEDK